MAVEWYIVNDEKEIGPFSVKQIKDLAESGCLKRSQRLRRADKSNSIVAEKVVGLFPQHSESSDTTGLPQNRTSSHATPNRPPPPSSRIVIQCASHSVSTNVGEPAVRPSDNLSQTSPSFPAQSSLLIPKASDHTIGTGEQARPAAQPDITSPSSPAISSEGSTSGVPAIKLIVGEVAKGIGALRSLCGSVLSFGGLTKVKPKSRFTTVLRAIFAILVVVGAVGRLVGTIGKNKNENTTAETSNVKPTSQNNAAPPENGPGAMPSLPRNVRRLKSLMNTPDGLGRAPASVNDDANNAVGNLAVYATNSEVIISFDGSGRNWPVINAGAHMLVRLFDSNGQYLTHFTTSETFTGEPRVAHVKPGVILLKGTNNRFIYPVNKRDLRDAAIVEVGFFFDW